jgi:hypothetical protein
MLNPLPTFGGNLALVESLAQHGVRFLVVGGLAVHHHAAERQADDLDLLVEQTVEAARSVTAALSAIGILSRFTEEQFANARKVQIKLEHYGLYADILTAGRDFDFDENWRHAEDALLGNTPVKIASISTLLLLLAGSKEPKHAADIALLHRLQATPRP